MFYECGDEKGAGRLGIKNVGDALDKGKRAIDSSCTAYGAGKQGASGHVFMATQDWPTSNESVRWQRRAVVIRMKSCSGWTESAKSAVACDGRA